MTDEFGQIQEVDWKEKFNINALPVEARGVFTDLLANANGARDYYRSREGGISDKQFEENIGENGDSPRKQIIHEIGNARLRAESMLTGLLPNYNYALVHPDDYQTLLSLDREGLVAALDDSIHQLYEASKDAANLERMIKIPYQEDPTNGINSLWAVAEHKILHLGMLITAGDCIGGVSRPESVKGIWG